MLCPKSLLKRSNSFIWFFEHICARALVFLRTPRTVIGSTRERSFAEEITSETPLLGVLCARLRNTNGQKMSVA